MRTESWVCRACGAPFPTLPGSEVCQIALWGLGWILLMRCRPSTQISKLRDSGRVPPGTALHSELLTALVNDCRVGLGRAADGVGLSWVWRTPLGSSGPPDKSLFSWMLPKCPPHPLLNVLAFGARAWLLIPTTPTPSCALSLSLPSSHWVSPF